MIEQTNAKLDSNAGHHNVSQAEAHAASQKMLTCVELHQRSSARDGNDKTINNAAMVTDKQSSENAANIKKVDAELLLEISSNQPISAKVKDEALKLHMQSRDLNNADAQGDAAAQLKDARDVQAEQKVINADMNLLRNDSISPNLRKWLQVDVQAKVQLQQNEKGDIPSEQAFAAADAKDQKLNKVIIDALSKNSPDLSSLSSSLWADGASKEGIISTRQDDLKAEPGYSKADTQDQTLDAQLNAALRMDPYLSASRRMDSNTPVWSSEQQVEKVEMLQHARRLSLSANGNAAASTYEQLNLPVQNSRAQKF
jgi:hypothetical protein